MTNKIEIPQSSSSTARGMTFVREIKKSFLQYANEQRNNGLTDVTIAVEGMHIPAHKIILAHSSKYFETVFKFDGKRSFKDMFEIRCDEQTKLNGEAVEQIIDSCYSGRITMNKSNVLSILRAADYLQVDDIMENCVEFLIDSLAFDNCLDTILMLNSYSLSHGTDLLKQFVGEHLAEISLQEKFKDLSKDDLRSIIEMVDLVIIMESSKYTAIIIWVMHKQETRKADLTELFELVRLDRVGTEFLEDVIAKNALIKENKVCWNALSKYFGNGKKWNRKAL